MIRYFALVSLISCMAGFPGISFSQTTTQIPPEKPKLVIQIIAGQMRYDYLSRYWNKFGEDGFKRLIDEGTFCRNANFPYLFTQSAPGHATIATGTTPDHHAIVSDQWYIRLKDEMIVSIFLFLVHSR